MELLLASKNDSKKIEIQQILGNNFKILSLLDFDKNVIDIKEDKATFEENALKKAKIIAQTYNILTISDDSGIEIPALNNWPGVYTKRLNKECIGDKMSNAERNQYILDKCKDIKDRTVIWSTAIAIYFPSKQRNVEKYKVFKSSFIGELALKPYGNNGFSFDSIIQIIDTNKTIACLTQNEKNKISPRKQSLEKLKIYLNNQ